MPDSKEKLELEDMDFWPAKVWHKGQGKSSRNGLPVSKSAIINIPAELAKLYGLDVPCWAALIPMEDGIFIKRLKLAKATH